MKIKYQQYIDDIKKLEMKKISLIEEYITKVMNDIDIELCKYFIKKTLKDIDLDISNKGHYDNNVYMLNDEYGIALNFINYNSNYNSLNHFSLYFKLIYKNKKINKFIISSTISKYSPQYEDISNVVKELYSVLKMKYNTRTKIQKNTEFKKQINKYNL